MPKSFEGFCVARTEPQDAIGIDTCYLMVFADTGDGAAFWTGIGASRRTELDLYSLSTAPH